MERIARLRVPSRGRTVKPVAVVAIGAESALGSGEAAYSVGALGERAVTAISADDRLRATGLRKPFVARAKITTDRKDLEPAGFLLGRAARALATDLDRLAPGWRTRRIGVAVGTSSGGMSALVTLLGLRSRGETITAELARAATYFGPLTVLDAELGIDYCERAQILAACASSGIAIGLGCRWLELGRADLVIAGGYDAVTALVAAGFESLGATSATRPSPFRAGRDGMALGEAAVLFALAPAGSTGALGYIRGFAASCDAVHVTAPDREGTGLARAAREALENAGIGPDSVDLVSAHGTATPFNDAAEARAISKVLGAHAETVVVHPFKAVVGHTLGASAALEAAAMLHAMGRGLLPAAAGSGDLDPDARVRLLDRHGPGRARHGLKLSAAFGGANASLVLSTEPAQGRPLEPRGVVVAGVGEPRTAQDVLGLVNRTRIAEHSLSRLDPLSAAAVAAAASAIEAVPDLPRPRTGVVVGTIAATLENDDAFDQRLRDRGARAVEPRRFPPTSPNLPPGQCSIAFGLLGPSLAVGSGPEAPIEALLVGFDLVAAGDADAVIVVSAEHVAGVVRDVFAAAGAPCPVDGAIAVVLRPGERALLSRPMLTEALQEARVAGGRVRGAAPGYPVLRAALRLASES